MMAVMDTQLPTLPPRLTYSLVETALVTGLSLSTINRRLASGEIKSVKVGRRRLVPTKELRRLCGEDRSPSVEMIAEDLEHA
jgi:excisionase family DNA binding protein